MGPLSAASSSQPGGSTSPRFRRSANRRGVSLADVEEVLGERGAGATTEMLVRWKGMLSTRPSWVLLSELKKNPRFRDVYEEYTARGASIVAPLGEE